MVGPWIRRVLRATMEAKVSGVERGSQISCI